MTEKDDDEIFACQKVIKSTGKAHFISVDGDEVWVPASQVKIFTEKEVQKIRMPAWLAKEKFPNG